MTTKIAGRLPLQDMISNVINDARQKLAAAEEKGESKAEEKKEEKIKKLVENEKREHGGRMPSMKEEEAEEKKEKSSSAFDFSDPDEVEKLASALDYVSYGFMKVADKIETGGESSQGGMVLPTAVPPQGVQPYKHDASKKHKIPMSTGLHSDPSQGSAATQVMNNIAKAPGGGGTQKETTASVSQINAALMKMANEETVDPGWWDAQGGMMRAARQGDKGLDQFLAHDELVGKRMKGNLKGGLAGLGIGGIGGALVGAALRHPAEGAMVGAALGSAIGSTSGQIGADIDYLRSKGVEPKLLGLGGAKFTPEAAKKYLAGYHEKKSSANLAYILNKIAETSQGGETLDSMSGQGIKPPSGSAGGNDVRRFLESSEAAVRMQKVDGKGPQKKSLAEILSEPAQTKSTDSKVHENLSNASKGGVKIAQARALLQKIAEEGCTCGDKGECKYCKMQAAKKAKKEEMAEAAKS